MGTNRCVMSISLYMKVNWDTSNWITFPKNGRQTVYVGPKPIFPFQCRENTIQRSGKAFVCACMCVCFHQSDRLNEKRTTSFFLIISNLAFVKCTTLFIRPSDAKPLWHAPANGRLLWDCLPTSTAIDKSWSISMYEGITVQKHYNSTNDALTSTGCGDAWMRKMWLMVKRARALAGCWFRSRDVHSMCTSKCHLIMWSGDREKLRNVYWLGLAGPHTFTTRTTSMQRLLAYSLHWHRVDVSCERLYRWSMIIKYPLNRRCVSVFEHVPQCPSLKKVVPRLSFSLWLSISLHSMATFSPHHVFSNDSLFFTLKNRCLIQ